MPEALMPLLEVGSEEQQVDLTKEILEFAARAFAAHNKRLDEQRVSEALKTVFDRRAKNMMPTIFEEKFMEGFAKAESERKPIWIAEGEARGEAKGRTKTIESVIQARFAAVPKTVQKRLAAVSDLGQLELLTKQAATCSSLKEFEKLLR